MLEGSLIYNAGFSWTTIGGHLGNTLHGDNANY